MVWVLDQVSLYCGGWLVLRVFVKVGPLVLSDKASDDEGVFVCHEGVFVCHEGVFCRSSYFVVFDGF